MSHMGPTSPYNTAMRCFSAPQAAPYTTTTIHKGPKLQISQFRKVKFDKPYLSHYNSNFNELYTIGKIIR